MPVTLQPRRPYPFAPGEPALRPGGEQEGARRSVWREPAARRPPRDSQAVEAHRRKTDEAREKVRNALRIED